MASSTISALPSTKFGTKPNNPTTSHPRGEPADSGTKDRSKVAESVRNCSSILSSSTCLLSGGSCTKRVRWPTMHTTKSLVSSNRAKVHSVSLTKKRQTKAQVTASQTNNKPV